MSLAHRIIPTILCRGRQAVKGKRFDSWRPIGMAAEKVRVHQMRGVDELVLLDITATAEGRGPDLKLVEELAEGMFAPLAVGGGVRTVDDVRALLRAGADKVVIGTASLETGVVREAAAVVGSQAITVAIDVKDHMVHGRCGSNPYHSSPSRPLRAASWAMELVQYGAGEILLQSIDRDGTLSGYDLALISEVSRAVGIPVIASGGAGCYDHMREAIEAGASAVAAGAMFQFTDHTPREAAKYLAWKGIEARL